MRAGVTEPQSKAGKDEVPNDCAAILLESSELKGCVTLTCLSICARSRAAPSLSGKPRRKFRGAARNGRRLLSPSRIFAHSSGRLLERHIARDCVQERGLLNTGRLVRDGLLAGGLRFRAQLR